MMEDGALARRVLETARVVAVLGANPDSSRPAAYVPEYLQHMGYKILPVSARFAGQTLFGETVRARLDELKVPVDVVDVFRRSEDVAGHLEEILAMDPLPKVVWLQLGIRDEATAERLRARGIEVIQSRCMLADHRSFGLGRVD